MNGVLLAESAVLVEFKSVRMILFVLGSVVIALFAFGASKGYFNVIFFFAGHITIPPTGVFTQYYDFFTFKKMTPLDECFNNIALFRGYVN